MPVKWMTRLIMALVALALGTGTAAACGTRISHSNARTQVTNAGISVVSSGGCSNRNQSNCTSLEQIHQHTIDGILTLKRSSGCGITITGGTETGHASGTYSHWNGYKLDISKSSCINGYITRNFTSIGGGKYKSAAGNIYYDEGNHWDITYY